MDIEIDDIASYFILGFFFGLFVMFIVILYYEHSQTNKELEELIIDGYCIINDNVNYGIQHYYGSIENNVICVDKNGVLHALREDLQVLI